MKFIKLTNINHIRFYPEKGGIVGVMNINDKNEYPSFRIDFNTKEGKFQINALLKDLKDYSDFNLEEVEETED